MFNITSVTASCDSSESFDPFRASKLTNNNYEITKLSSLNDLDFFYREGLLVLKGV